MNTRQNLSTEEESIIRMAQAYGQQRGTCPFCSPERSTRNKNERCLSMKKDDTGIVYSCQHCGVSGSVFTGARMTHFPTPEPKPITVLDPANAPKLDERHYAWLKNQRGISPEAADEYGLFSTEKYFPAVQRKEQAIGFPYFNCEGQIVSAKIRSIESKAFTCFQSPPSFFGLDKISIGDNLVIVEGELDVLAMAESGIKAVSVPNGAPIKVVDGKISPADDNKFRFIWAAKEYIDAAKQIVIAVDGDGPGSALAEEIARRVGKDRCWRIIWPEGTKDANDYLLAYGAPALADIIRDPDPWPIAGLYDAMSYEKQLKELYENGAGRGESTGYANVDELYTIKTGQMTVVTGIPSSGKSEFIDQIMVNLAEEAEWKFAICSFENEPRIHISKLMSKRARKAFFTGANKRMDEHDFAAALSWIDDHFIFLQQEDGALSNLDSILDRLKTAVMRIGIRGAVIDPYNYIDKPKDISETDWISLMLTKIKAFAMAHDIHIWFVAHPTKLQRDKDGKLPVPKGYDISGCHDAYTEVLTSSGWVAHPELTEDHLVAAYNPSTGALHYEKPQQIHAYDHDGAMHHWSGASLDMMVTPNHRMVAKRKPNDCYDFVVSSDITPGRWYFPSSSAGIAGGDDSISGSIDLGYDPADLMWFMGFWVAEGCVQSNSLSVCQAVDKYERPKSVMDRLGLVYTDKISDGRFREKRMWVSRLLRQWHIDLIDTVTRECGVGAANKQVPNMLWGMTREAKMAFLNGYWFGDGSTRQNSRQAYTISEQLSDDIQRLAVECGLFTTSRKDYSTNEKWADRYAVTWRDQPYRSVQTDRNFKEVSYTGKVYCVTVSTGAYVTRRNGKVAYQGNSAAWFAKADCGLTVHRIVDENPLEAQIYIWKCRFAWIGKQGETRLYYDIPTTRYNDFGDGYIAPRSKEIFI